jgi:hypothetical protein
MDDGEQLGCKQAHANREGASSFHVDNHYVPRLYLKRFVGSNQKLCKYQLLVPHAKFPEWKHSTVKGCAHRDHLYTRLIVGVESDDFETWLNEQFETPAEAPLTKANSGLPLTPKDWDRLVLFLAAQDVRTPARLMENLERWKREIPEVLDQCLKDAVEKLKEAKRTGLPLSTSRTVGSEYIPVKVRMERLPDDSSMAALKAETVAGRGTFLFSIKHALTHTARALLAHRWTVLRAPHGILWPTSDDPVIKLNYEDETHYDFQGGWGSKGTDIFLPIDPHHLLYTRAGGPVPARGTEIPREVAEKMVRMIVRHAHRYVYAQEPIQGVSEIRQRIVDLELTRQEDEHWKKWHEQQSKAERELMGW